MLLIPILYLTQEITARLGVVTGKGHGALIRATFGAKWALLSAGTLFVACVGALITEFAAISLALSALGISPYISVPASAVGLTLMVVTGTLREGFCFLR